MNLNRNTGERKMESNRELTVSQFWAHVSGALGSEYVTDTAASGTTVPSNKFLVNNI